MTARLKAGASCGAYIRGIVVGSGRGAGAASLVSQRLGNGQTRGAEGGKQRSRETEQQRQDGCGRSEAQRDAQIELPAEDRRELNFHPEYPKCEAGYRCEKEPKERDPRSFEQYHCDQP